ncbi:chemotaxis protein CheR [Oleispira antarctica]|uniref:Chemotaxis protein methyltransferase n=1 Tax=Oleispira antarctica TaxID=188908 RepID=A0A1Y5HU49_OLEAN|nr:chemotaxis protein CheR [Oleispira antarctica]
MEVDYRGKEFPMTYEDFQRIAGLAGRYTGIVLGEHKQDMVYGRIARRVRKLNLNDFSSYLDFLEANIDKELSNFINVITTNLTSFFRENHHFEYLQKTVLTELKRKNSATKRLRIWSAGCSKGMEPYSISMTLLKSSIPSDWDVKLLATDLDSEVLDTAREAIYSATEVDGLEESTIKNYFQRGGNGKDVKVKDKVRQFIHFKRLNLLETWPMTGPFDFIFCRNVVIYFDKPTQKVLFDRYADLLNVGGYLFIGHSENLHGISERFENMGNTIYRKIR